MDNYWKVEGVALTSRTKAKIEESLDIFLKNLTQTLELPENHPKVQHLQYIFYSVLQWMAEDVMKQAR